MNLLCSNLEAPKDYEIFADEDVQDIVEPYDEDEEKRWRGNASHLYVLVHSLNFLLNVVFFSR